jgi:hypothetical protein
MNRVARVKLCELYAERGRELLEHPERLEALLRDLCAEMRAEIRVLCAANEERVPAQMLNAHERTPIEVQLARLTLQLVDNTGISEENARWAVEAWAVALGLMDEELCTDPDPSHAWAHISEPSGPVKQPLEEGGARLPWEVLLACAACVLFLGLLCGAAVWLRSYLLAPTRTQRPALSTLQAEMGSRPRIRPTVLPAGSALPSPIATATPDLTLGPAQPQTPAPSPTPAQDPFSDLLAEPGPTVSPQADASSESVHHLLSPASVELMLTATVAQGAATPESGAFDAPQPEVVGGLKEFFNGLWNRQASNDTADYASDFASQIEYCYKEDGGLADRAFVERDRHYLVRQYPDRHYELLGAPEVSPVAGGEYQISYRAQYDYSGQSKHASGITNVTLQVRNQDGRWHVTRFHETVERK